MERLNDVKKEKPKSVRYQRVSRETGCLELWVLAGALTALVFLGAYNHSSSNQQQPQTTIWQKEQP